MRCLFLYILLFLSLSANGQFMSSGFLKHATGDSTLKFTVDTDLGTGDSFDIPMKSGYSYDYTVYWGDGNSSDITAYDDADKSHTYDAGGEYQITIEGTFGGFYFNNGGDKAKVTSVDNWGWTTLNTNQTNAFNGCENLDSLAGDDLGMQFFNTVLTNGYSMFFNNSLPSLPDVMTLASLTNGFYMFYNNFLTSLPDVMTLASLTTGYGMFQNNSLPSLPDVMTLASLTTGYSMFRRNSFADTLDCSNFTQFQGNWDLAFYTNTSLEYITLPTITGQFSNFDANNCDLSQAGVDNILDHFRKYHDPDEDGTAETAPTDNLTIDLSGGTNASPTDGASNDDIVDLGTMYTAAGYTFTAIINTP